MNYETSSAEEIAAHFGTISRQRISQILLSYQKRDAGEIVAKILQAKKLLKTARQFKKNGCTVEEILKVSSIWRGMQERVGIHPSYLDCSIAFVNEKQFRQWAYHQIGFNEEGFELDKDILIKGNRVYSPDACVFVPAEINSVLAGCYKAKKRGAYPLGVCFNKGSGTFVAQMNKDRSVSLDKYLGSFKTVEEAFACYKAAKEEKIKRLAEKWKSRIDPRAYAALMARTVEWDD